MAAGTRRMTVAEYEKLPSPPGGWYELHHGEAVLMTRPVLKHIEIQRRIQSLLANLVSDYGIVWVEVPFRPSPEHEVWAADVAVVSKLRWNPEEKYLLGAPELVIEVLSPSNTAEEIFDKETVCLSAGAVQFWVVDEKRRQVKVSVAGGPTTTYRERDSIPLDAYGGGSLAVTRIF